MQRETMPPDRWSEYLLHCKHSDVIKHIWSTIIVDLSSHTIPQDGFLICEPSLPPDAVCIIGDLEGDYPRLLYHLTTIGYKIFPQFHQIQLLRNMRGMGDLFGDIGGNGSIRILVLMLHIMVTHGNADDLNALNILNTTIKRVCTPFKFDDSEIFASLIVGNRDMILPRINTEIVAWREHKPITPYWCKADAFQTALSSVTTDMEFVDVVAKQSMAAPNLVKVFEEEITILELGSSYDVLYSLFFSPNSVLLHLLMFMNVVDIQNNTIFTHIPPTEERIMKRNFNGTYEQWDDIYDWVSSVNEQYKESVSNIIMNGAEYCKMLKGLSQEDLDKSVWTSGKASSLPCEPMGSYLFRAAMGVDTDGSPTCSLQQGTSILNIDGFTEPYDLSFLEHHGITNAVHAHKPHLGFYTKRCGNVTSIAIDHLRASNALYLDSETWSVRIVEKKSNFPNTSTYGHVVDVCVINNTVQGRICFPGGIAFCNLLSEQIGSRYGPWSVISTDCKLDDNDKQFVMLAAQYEVFPLFQLYVQFVEIEKFVKGEFNFAKPI
jgi:hypothetical protein